MIKIDHVLSKIILWAKKQPLLYRFTLGVKVLLAIAFIPTGAVKLLGLRFTSLNSETEVGAFFEILYQSGHYWKFLGAAQVIAGILILAERTSAIGAILFLAIISNIWVITISYEFSGTPWVAFAMFMASVWLLFWDWQRLRPLFFINAIQPLEVASPRLHSNFERTIYLLFFGAGLLVFSVLRGLHVPMPAFYGSLLIMVVSFSIAVVIALVHQIKYR